jgi:hypothetical protein
MKKSFFLSLLLLSAIISYSQNRKLLLIGGEIGGMYSGNHLSYNSLTNTADLSGVTPDNLLGTIGENNSGDYTTTYFDISPSVMIYLTDRFLIGMEFSLLNEHNKYESDFVTKTYASSYLVSPCIRYFIYRGLYSQLQYFYGVSHQNVRSGKISIPGSSGVYTYDITTDLDARTNGAGLTAGYMIPIGERMNIDVALSYIMNNSKYKYKSGQDDGDYTFKQKTLMISLGFKHVINRKL